MWQFLQLIVGMDNSSCQTACGMVGSCDGNADNDMPFNKMTTNVTDIAFRASYASLLPVEQSLFSINSDDLDLAQLTKAGYSLSFNNTAGTSDPLTNTPTSYGGILFSYANKKTFALSNDYNSMIHCGQTSISTVPTNTLDAWNKIILADERDAGRLHFYHIGPNSGLVCETFGSWQVAQDATRRRLPRLGGRRRPPESRLVAGSPGSNAATIR